jgi:hypothetical protein
MGLQSPAGTILVLFLHLALPCALHVFDCHARGVCGFNPDRTELPEYWTENVSALAPILPD